MAAEVQHACTREKSATSLLRLVRMSRTRAHWASGSSGPVCKVKRHILYQLHTIESPDHWPEPQRVLYGKTVLRGKLLSLKGHRSSGHDSRFTCIQHAQNPFLLHRDPQRQGLHALGATLELLTTYKRHIPDPESAKPLALVAVTTRGTWPGTHPPRATLVKPPHPHPTIAGTALTT